MKHFKNHEAGDKDDEYAKYVELMNTMTNRRQRMSKPKVDI